MYFCIAGILENEAQNVIRERFLLINQKYDIGVTSVLLPQHISLKITFKTEEVELLKNYFDAFADSLKKIEIQFTHMELIKLTEGNSETGILWYRVMENKELRNIHNRLNDDLSQLLGITNSRFDGNQFMFHSTICYGKKTFDEYKVIHEKEKDSFKEYEAKLLEIGLFACHDDAGSAGTFYTYRLKNLTIG